MYRSLEKNCSDFHLYIIAFDDLALSVLKKMNLKYATIISLKEFEDKELLQAKETRDKVEYMWTCSSASIYYVLKKYKVPSCTYIDADLYFYSNPKILIDEIGKSSVLISEHRYTEKYDQTKISGKYCVQFMTFKNNKFGLKVLNWWRNACLNWCYAKPEDGKFGDQKYLDDWTTRFEGIHVLNNLGGGVAPWNMQQYKFVEDNHLIESSSNKEFNLVFFHFHSLKIFSNGKLDLCPYFLPKEFLSNIYLPYVRELLSVRKELILVDKRVFSGKIVPKTSLKTLILNIRRAVFNEFNNYNIDYFR
ncbi:MAG: glycosyl transferase [archaeon]|jgi:hypothetical protein